MRPLFGAVKSHQQRSWEEPGYVENFYCDLSETCRIGSAAFVVRVRGGPPGRPHDNRR